MSLSIPRATVLVTVALLTPALASLQDCLNHICASRSDCVGFANDGLDILNTYQRNWVKPYNLAVDVNPEAVVRPNSSQEVAAIVQCAAENGYKVQAKSGGHSYANFGLGDGAVAIDLVNINQYSIDNTTGYATIGAGSRLGEIDKRLHETGRAFAHGVCPSVGIGGHATIVSHSQP
jgi:FAD/FMN-containing dehydrogenase